MESETKCPHCNEDNCIPDVAFRNVEFYGGKTFNVGCVKCSKPIKVTLTRVVQVRWIEKSNSKDFDF